MDRSRRGFARSIALGSVLIAGCASAPDTQTDQPPEEATDTAEPSPTPEPPTSTASEDSFPTQPLYLVNRTDDDACVQLTVTETLVGSKTLLDGTFRVPADGGVVFDGVADIGVEHRLDCALPGGRELSTSWLVKSCGGLDANRPGKLSFGADSLYFSEGACDVADPALRGRRFRTNPDGEGC